MAKLITPAQPTMPWQDRPEGHTGPIWRYDANPILTPADVPHANSVFNSAVTPFGDGYAGVFRCDSRALQMDIFVGFSDDGIHWEISDQPIKFEGVDDAITKKEYRYDPRVIWIEDRYLSILEAPHHRVWIAAGFQLATVGSTDRWCGPDSVWLLPDSYRGRVIRARRQD